MRMMINALALTSALVSLSMLTACGEGSAFDEGFKAEYRTKLVSGCTSTAQGSIPAGVNIDLDKICGCAADKIMEGKSAKDLMSSVPGSEEDFAKVQTCVSELYPNGLNIRIDTK